MGEIVFFLERTRTSILDDVDLLTEGPIAPPRPRSVYFDVVVEAGRPGFEADSFRQGLQEALVQDPDLLALGRKQGGDLSGAHRLHARRLDRPRRRRHHHRRQRQSGVDVLLSRRRMPEWGRPGGEWRWRSPSAKQLSGLSGICRLNSVQASQAMASSRRVSGDISGAGLRCPAQPDRTGACWMLDISERSDKIERQWVVPCILA
jgi:hypothetical protein